MIIWKLFGDHFGFILDFVLGLFRGHVEIISGLFGKHLVVIWIFYLFILVIVLVII